MNTSVEIYKPLLNDIVFKYIFGYSKNIVYTEYLLELLLNMEIGSLKDKIDITNSFDLDKTSYIERGLEVDIRVKMPNNEYIDLEAYTTFDMISKLKSTMYLGHMFSTQLIMGEEINKAKPHLQINFVKGLNIKSKIFNIISEDESREYFIGDYFKIRVINVDEYKDICYNELDKLTRLLRFMSAENESEELEIIRGDVMLENIYNDKKEFLQSEWASRIFTDKNLMKSRHNAEIEEKNSIIENKDNTIKETIKNLISKKFSLEEISNVTKLSIAEIENILNEKQD